MSPLTDAQAEGTAAAERYQVPVEGRFPGDLGRKFTAVPVALFDLGGDLGLTTLDKLLLIALDRYRFGVGGWVWPSIETLARDTGCGESTVRKRLARLVTKGLLIREYESHAGQWRHAKYDLSPLWAELAALDRQRSQGAGATPDQRYELAVEATGTQRYEGAGTSATGERQPALAGSAEEEEWKEKEIEEEADSAFSTKRSNGSGKPSRGKAKSGVARDLYGRGSDAWGRPPTDYGEIVP
jgi:hypothetical protein